ncbi:hypothetical protein V6N12_074961 [Hibiscus sabdariffa]|uniref:MORF/ORRM1/DAG-like MORF domain-containing protein n=1 Tax=Hibiscus sabdariffa TaxID=183260 RepID=A0ABR1ZX49_9ROSI
MERLSSVVQKLIGRRFSTYPSSSRRILSRYISSNAGYNNSVLPERVELTRTPVLVEGCDYEHWFVVMEAPKGYPLRDEIVNTYIKTLAMALGSEEEAKKSIYSVSTKYYYAFGCKVPEDLAFKIKSLPNVKWVLPDSYLDGRGDGSYGGVCLRMVIEILDSVVNIIGTCRCWHATGATALQLRLGELNEKKRVHRARCCFGPSCQCLGYSFRSSGA